MHQKKHMISGFTFIKNGISLGYPIRESIESISPLCDEIIINVGYDDENLSSDDGTYDYLRDSFPEKKYHFLKSFWNPKLQEKGLILSQQTNIALEKCQGSVCQYIQGDEVLHEEDLSEIEKHIADLIESKTLEGLIYHYIHFYGNVDLYKYTRNIYRREVRTIKNGLNIISWLDAQGFRHRDQTKIRAKLIKARIFHYGWARKEMIMKDKIDAINKLYNDSNSNLENNFKYSHVYGLKKFEKTHPHNMNSWVKEHKNEINLLDMKPNFKFKHFNLAFSDWIEKVTDYRIGEYKNYILTKE